MLHACLHNDCRAVYVRRAGEGLLSEVFAAYQVGGHGLKSAFVRDGLDWLPRRGPSKSQTGGGKKLAGTCEIAVT